MDDQRLLGRIRQSWLESGGVYGYRKVCDDMRDLGESCGANRVARLMRTEGLRAERGYGRRPGKHGGKPAEVAPNHLQREFSVPQPNRVWVTDITYIRTHEDGCTWPLSWTCSHGKSWAGPCSRGSIENWH